MRLLLIFFLYFSLAPAAFSQNRKVKTIKFCGVSYTNPDKMKKLLEEQFTFLRVNDGDTIVDIGAGSGWYDGAFSAVSSVNGVHFILVDIDSGCLNQEKVNNMVAHYSGLKGKPITNTFSIVNNTPDSLYLPANGYRKVWLMNVLHEIKDKENMLADIATILRDGGELILWEIIPKKPGDRHGGCKKPLQSLEEWKALFERSGFRYSESIQVQVQKKVPTVNVIRFIKV